LKTEQQLYLCAKTNAIQYTFKNLSLVATNATILTDLSTGFVWFIVTLKKKAYKYQFSQYAWTHMILLMVFAQSSFTVANIFDGIFW
jgi:hypothetical protein